MLIFDPHSLNWKWGEVFLAILCAHTCVMGQERNTKGWIWWNFLFVILDMTCVPLYDSLFLFSICRWGSTLRMSAIFSILNNLSTTAEPRSTSIYYLFLFERRGIETFTGTLLLQTSKLAPVYIICAYCLKDLIIWWVSEVGDNAQSWRNNTGEKKYAHLLDENLKP